MRILLVSDSHGNQEALDNLIRLWPDVGLYLHAGDGECHSQEIFPFRMVRGNCDYAFDLINELIIPTPFGNILMRHTPDVTSAYLKEHNIRVFIYGHTHKRVCYEKYNVAFINPGAISYARDAGPSYAILENEERDILVSFYSLETNKVIQKFRVYYKGDEIGETQCIENIAK